MRHPPPAEVGEEMRPARDALLHGEHPRALADEVTDGLAQVVAAPLPPATTLSSHAASSASILASGRPLLGGDTEPARGTHHLQEATTTRATSASVLELSAR